MASGSAGVVARAACAIGAAAAVLLATAEPGAPVAPATLCGSTTGYQWPLRPFKAPHPVRSNLGEPRIKPTTGSVSFHNGIDIAARPGAAVYPVMSGVVTRVTGSGVVVTTQDRRRFQYWHIVPAVEVGRQARVGVTILGRVHEEAHVHLAELDPRAPGVVQNPLAPGRLAPYEDRQPPSVHSITIAGRDAVVWADDYPALPVPGAWNSLPVAPAYLTYTIRRPDGTVASSGPIVDFRTTLPQRKSFWDVYATGTQPSKAGRSGRYLYRFALPSLPAGEYTLTVVAHDSCGNRGGQTTPLSVP